MPQLICHPFSNKFAKWLEQIHFHWNAVLRSGWQCENPMTNVRTFRTCIHMKTTINLYMFQMRYASKHIFCGCSMRNGMSFIAFVNWFQCKRCMNTSHLICFHFSSVISLNGSNAASMENAVQSELLLSWLVHCIVNELLWHFHTHTHCSINGKPMVLHSHLDWIGFCAVCRICRSHAFGR